MSNYIRTLLRFEKERAARRASGQESTRAEVQPPEEGNQGGVPRSGFWTTTPSPAEEGAAVGSQNFGFEPEEGEAPIDLAIRVPDDLPFELAESTAAQAATAEPAKKAAEDATVEVQWWPEPGEVPAAKSPRQGWLAGLLSLLPFLERRRRQVAARSSAHTSTAYAQLLDSLRAVETSFSAPGVVLASAGSADSMSPVLQGLRDQARRKGLRLLVAELVVSKGGRVLGGSDPACTAELLEFNRTVTEDTVRNWFERAVTGQDLLIVEAPPLSQSVDAGLLARACDGLALVVEPQRTSRHEFETAVERSKASGSFLLGMVMSHHTHWLPHFLRTFFNSYPRLIRQPQRTRSR